MLQKVLITGKQNAPYKFERCVSWQDEHWQVSDRLMAESWQGVISADIGCDRTSIYVVMSRTFQSGQLQSPLDLSDRIKTLEAGNFLSLIRDL